MFKRGIGYLFLLGLLVAAAHSQVLSVELTPHNPPVRIPYDGGSFDYNIDVTNSDTSHIDLDVWTMYTLPGGGTYGPVHGPVQTRLPGGWTGSSNLLVQPVPESMPAGDYHYRAYAGRYPDSIWAADSFGFEKAAVLPGWYSQTSGTDRYLTAVHFPHPDTGWAVGVVRTILHTTDGGGNWYSQSAPNFTHFSDVYFADTRTGWAIGDLGIIQHTTDGGDSWFRQETGVSSAGVMNGMHWVDRLTGWIAGGKPWTTTGPYRFIIHTTDGGYTWNSQHFAAEELPLYDISFADAMHGYAVGQGNVILQTADGGANWTEYPIGVYEVNDVFCSDDSTAWAVGRDGAMFRTTNYGASWVVQYPGTTDELRSIVFTHPDTGWTAGGNGENPVILHTTNGGTSWSAQDPASDYGLFDIFFHDGELGWAVGPYGEVQHTTTGGGIHVGVEEPPVGHDSPSRLGLRPRSSNPFTGSAVIEYSLSRAGHVRLALYDASGRRVRMLVDGPSSAGTHLACLDGSGLPAGSYIARLASGGDTVAEELVLAR